MWASLGKLWRITAFRLSLIYTLIFGLAAVGIIFYMTGATVNLVRQQYETSIEKEIDGLGRAYQRGGINLLFRVLERRANAPGANLYAVSDPQGRIIAGNVPNLPRNIMRKTGWINDAFRYERFDPQNESDRPSDSRAIGRVLEVPNGMRILVGRDVGEYETIGKVVGDAVKFALATMLGLGLLTWFFVGRRALKRIDKVTESSRRILSGDRTERLPVTGSNDEFDRLSINLNRMLDRINNLDEGLKQISDNIAHDLKTPITRLRNKAEEALDNNADVKGRDAIISEIISDCDQIVKTFDALMMISRVDSGSTVAKLQAVNLVEILSDVHELYEAVAEDNGIDLKLEMENTAPVVIRGNRELLSQAVSNLIDNAMKYGHSSAEQSVITLSLKQLDDTAEITIADNGPGVPEEDMGRVKDRFVRLDQSRNKPGNGLGLSLVDAIALLHEGKLSLSDNAPGLEVTLKLPLKAVSNRNSHARNKDI